MANPEVYHGNGETTAEIQKAAAERSAELRERSIENGERPEAKAEHLAQEARAEAEKQARPAEDYRPAAEKETASPPVITTKRSPEKAYRQTLERIQGEMSAPARTFSKVIHNKTVEKVSDAAGVTIARPTSLLSGAICASAVVFALYLHARYFGYALQGSETILAFIIGYILGIAIDLIRTMIRGKR